MVIFFNVIKHAINSKIDVKVSYFNLNWTIHDAKMKKKHSIFLINFFVLRKFQYILFLNPHLMVVYFLILILILLWHLFFV